MSDRFCSLGHHDTVAASATVIVVQPQLMGVVG